MDPRVEWYGRAVLAILSIVAPSAASAQCEPSWGGGFGQPNSGPAVRAMASFADHGPSSPPALFMGGDDPGKLIRWQRGERTVVTTGAASGFIYAMTVFDPDGTGPAPAELVVGYNPGVTKWDGVAWSSLGTGVNGQVSALMSFGGRLIAGGSFTSAGGVQARSIAAWDGTTWAPMGTGFVGSSAGIYSLASFDDGHGAGVQLYAGGSFTSASGTPMTSIARWNGTGWERVGAGMTGVVSAMAVFDDGAGPALYAGGGTVRQGIQRWDGHAWTDVGGGLTGVQFYSVNALVTMDLPEDGRRVLVACGSFNQAGGQPALGVAYWDGVHWTALAGGVRGNAITATVYDDPDPRFSGFYIGGSLTQVSANLLAVNAVRLDRSSWTTLGEGVTAGPTSDEAVNVARSFSEGAVGIPGSSLVIGGRAMVHAGTTRVSCVAVWDGEHWSGLPGLNPDISTSVNALEMFDGGSGRQLYVGGSFASFRGIARWDGTMWQGLGSGLNVGARVQALRVFDDGHGPRLFVGGLFQTSGTAPLRNVATWDGTSWAPAGSLDGEVDAFEVFDDGSGPAIYACGWFVNSGSTTVNKIAKWNGTEWVGLVDAGGVVGVTGVPQSMAVYDDGRGPALYVGGWFSSAGRVSASNIARWDGHAWEPLSTGVSGGQDPTFGTVVYALTAASDRPGHSALIAGGSFSRAGLVTASAIARWDGASWSSMMGGLTATPSSIPAVTRSLATWNGQAERGAIAVGRFTQAGLVSSLAVALWSFGTDPADWDHSGSVTSADFFAFLVSFFAGEADFNHSGATESQDLFDFLGAYFHGC